MRRPWLPIVGAVGFDGGSKRAISFVLPKREEDGPPPPEPTGLPTAILACDSIAASKSKCGYNTWDSSPGHYLTKTTVQTCYTADGPRPTDTCTRTIDPDTCLESSAIGTGSGCGATTSCDVVGSSGNCNVTCDYTNPTILTCEGDPCSPTFPDNGFHSTHTLSNEYTTALLISNTIAALPAYDDDFDDFCFASRDLPSTESSYSIQRTKYKVVLSSPAPADLIANYDRIFTPPIGSPSSTALTATIASGDMESAVITQNEPATNGVYTFTQPIVTLAP